MSLPIERIDDYRWRIPAGSKPGMKVPAIIFADEKLMEQIRHDLSLEQAANAATLPGRGPGGVQRCRTSTRGTGCPSARWWRPGRMAVSSRRAAWATTSTAACGSCGRS